MGLSSWKSRKFRIFAKNIPKKQIPACLGGTVGSIIVRTDWLRWLASPGPTRPIIVTGYSGVCFEIKFSGRHRGFDSVLFNLWPLANTGFRDAQY